MLQEKHSELARHFGRSSRLTLTLRVSEPLEVRSSEPRLSSSPSLQLWWPEFLPGKFRVVAFSPLARKSVFSHLCLGSKMRSVVQKNSRRLWRSRRRKSSSVAADAANFPTAVFLAGKCPNLDRDSISRCRKIGESFSSSVEICRKTFPAGNFGQPQPSRVFWVVSLRIVN